MLGKQASDERLYLKRDDGGRGLKSMRDVYKETKLRVGCYMLKSTKRLIQAAWRNETPKEENAIVVDALQVARVKNNVFWLGVVCILSFIK